MSNRCFIKASDDLCNWYHSLTTVEKKQLAYACKHTHNYLLGVFKKRKCITTDIAIRVAFYKRDTKIEDIIPELKHYIKTEEGDNEAWKPLQVKILKKTSILKH